MNTLMKEEIAHSDNLLVQLQQGNANAFQLLFDLYYPKILNLCYRYIGTREDAEEIAQDVFIKVHQNIHHYEPQGKEFTYLFRIAVNLSLNRIRDKKRKKWLSFDILKENQGHEPAGDKLLQPDIALEKKEQSQRIWQALQKLPEKQRTAVILKRYQDLSYEEISDILQCSVSAVEARLHRAKQSLKIIFKKMDL